jgi:ubiquinone/menaquinone biosynthesis C-methylase UbiE
MPEPDEQTTAAQYDAWVRRNDALGQFLRFAMTPAGALFINTPVFTLPRELDLRPHHAVLDLGCGQGAIARVLASLVPFDRPVVGIDSSEGMLRLGQEAIGPDAGSYIAFTQGSATSLPFGDETFDVVVSAHVVKHLSDESLHECFGEVLRVLRPGGICVLWEFTPTRSRLLNQLNRKVLTRQVKRSHIRSFRRLAYVAMEVGFYQVLSLGLRPFLWPPIPRVSMLLRKAG